MTRTGFPYALPDVLDPSFAWVEAYWRSLLRGSADVPFDDDLHLETLSDLSPRILLLDALNLPERFRFSRIGEELQATQGSSVLGLFVDGVQLDGPLRFLRSQASATVEARAPTYLELREDEQPNAPEFARLLLPFWGESHISLILGFVERRRSSG